jgi:hypothetical protein
VDYSQQVQPHSQPLPVHSSPQLQSVPQDCSVQQDALSLQQESPDLLLVLKA